MENSIAVLAETFGAETVLSAVVVCVVMMLIRKFKPELSPKAEVGVRFIISLLVHLLFILISQGEILGLAQGATSVCGVSMIVCTLISKKGGKEKVKEGFVSFEEYFTLVFVTDTYIFKLEGFGMTERSSHLTPD